jgi:hypothetical protein
MVSSKLEKIVIAVVRVAALATHAVIQPLVNSQPTLFVILATRTAVHRIVNIPERVQFAECPQEAVIHRKLAVATMLRAHRMLMPQMVNSSILSGSRYTNKYIGTACGNSSSLQCSSGQCTSRDLQCKTLMGSYTQGNDTYACSSSGCQISCASPEFGSNTCYSMQQNLTEHPAKEVVDAPMEIAKAQV